MSFQFIANLILILCVLGLLVIFLRRLPEVAEEKERMAMAVGGEGMSGAYGTGAGTGFKALLKSGSLFVWNKTKKYSGHAGKKVWTFMLEAKDFKQGQILASRFAELVRPRPRLQNIGALSSMKKAERQAQEGDFEGAEQTYIQVIRKNPHEYLAYEGLLQLYSQREKHGDAIEILRFLTENNPDNDMYWAQLGHTSLLLRRFQDSADAYARAVALNDLVAPRFINLGLALQALGDLEGARKHIQRGVDLDPSNEQYVEILENIR